MNVKNYEAARTVLTKLNDQIKAEAKTDPRLKNAARRTARLLAVLAVAQGKYEIVCSKKVPAKIEARKKAAKKAKPSNVVKLPTKKAA